MGDLQRAAEGQRAIDVEGTVPGPAFDAADVEAQRSARGQYQIAGEVQHAALGVDQAGIDQCIAAGVEAANAMDDP